LAVAVCAYAAAAGKALAITATSSNERLIGSSFAFGKHRI
jgi:hypothetical protein